MQKEKIKKLEGIIGLGENRGFGKAFGTVLVGASALVYLLGNETLALWLSVSGGSAFFLSILIPKVLYPLNFAWMLFGHVIGLVARPLAFGAIFYLILSPLSLALKIFGRDELKLDPKVHTLWLDSSSPKIEKSFENQY